MTVSYSFVALPLDAADPAATPRSFNLSLLSTLEFSEGQVAADEITAAVGAHPLLRRDAALPLPALAMPYAAWIRAPTPMTPQTAGVRQLALRYRGTSPFSRLQTTLRGYLARPGGVKAARVRHDDSHDKRQPEDFLDITGMYDGVVQLREALLREFKGALGVAPRERPDDVSDKSIGYAQKRWLEGQAQQALIAALFADDASFAPAGVRGDDAVIKLQRDIALLAKRLTPGPPRPTGATDQLRAFSPEGSTGIDVRDPNAAVHAALTNGLIAHACGIVTEWTAEADALLDGDLVIALDAAAFTNTAVICRTTAFRRTQQTHPLGFRDVGKPTSGSGLALLNDDTGTPRYSCTGIEAETATIQATILQANNSLSSTRPQLAVLGDGHESQRDDRPPVELAAQQFGFNELEAAGLTISAPVDDLVVPEALKSPTREQALPCLFLEDLWIGYRLDIAAEGEGPLRSVHRQTQRVTFSASGRTLNGEVEDFSPREPANEERTGTSTEILRFNGLSNAQNIDYAKFLGTYQAPTVPSGAPFAVEVQSCSGVTPIRFGKMYHYRLRNVFQGGISYRDDDSQLDRFKSQHVQTAPYLRARSFRAGELLLPPGSQEEGEKNPISIFLTDKMRSSTILVAPAPVDPDTARYNGQFLADSAETRSDKGRAFVTDLPAYLASQGTDAPYYCDPDVSEIMVEVWVRNGDPSSTEHDFMYEEGVYCELVEPLHLGPVAARFGPSGRWREFRPIEIEVSATSGARPKLQAKSGGRRVAVAVPVWAEVEIVLTPRVSVARLQKTASFASSSTQLALSRPDRMEGESLPVVEHRIRAVHCSKKPRTRPAIVSELNAKPETSPGIAILKRERMMDNAQIVGFVEADAASTRELQVEGSWSDIDDDPMHERFVLKAGNCVSRPRSIVFQEYTPPAPAVFLRELRRSGFLAGSSAVRKVVHSIGRQCSENRVFTGGATPQPQVADAIPSLALSLGDTRRKRLTLVAKAMSRYSSQFPPQPQQNFELASAPLAADVPASMVLPAPVISHVMPLIRQIEGREKGRRARQRIYAFRIYVRRPWFVSGPGERLAIGCHLGAVPKGPREVLDRHFTQWGEDPVGRAQAQASRRLPRAVDFRAAQPVTLLDPALYPPDSPETAAAVLYADDVVREDADDGADNARLSLASFALRWDEAQRLWYCDVDLASQFGGWIGLALYRHQPHAHEGLQLSPSAAWVYSIVLHGERVTWVRQNNRLNVTIGPVFDRSLSFEAEQPRYSDGVSDDLTREPRRRMPFRTYEVEGRRYFQGYFPAGSRGLEIIRRRFDFDISSFTLEGS